MKLKNIIIMSLLSNIAHIQIVLPQKESYSASNKQKENQQMLSILSQLIHNMLMNLYEQKAIQFDAQDQKALENLIMHLTKTLVGREDIKAIFKKILIMQESLEAKAEDLSGKIKQFKKWHPRISTIFDYSFLPCFLYYCGLLSMPKIKAKDSVDKTNLATYGALAFGGIISSSSFLKGILLNKANVLEEKLNDFVTNARQESLDLIKILNYEMFAIIKDHAEKNNMWNKAAGDEFEQTLSQQPE